MANHRANRALWLAALVLWTTAISHAAERSVAKKPDKAKVSDPFPANSVWDDPNSKMRLVVIERDGDTFLGRLEVGDKVVREITGTCKGNKVSWLRKDVRAVNGGPGGDNEGKLGKDKQGFRIDFTWRREDGGVGGTFTLRRSRADVRAGGSSLVTVDFSRPELNVKSMSGFLHSITATEPKDELVLPLRPALWRISGWYGNSQERLSKMNIPLILVLSDTYQGSYDKPLRDLNAWESHVRQIATNWKKYDLVWDIWNEPDIPGFWKGDQATFFETFARAAKALREELGPKTVISGPSLTNYDVGYLTKFLDYCKSQRIRLDVLSWHELGVDANIPSITEHLQDARKRFLANPAYESLHIKSIQINEIIGQSSTNRPGEILGYLQALERGGADGACKSCWGTCWNNTLDGLLTPDRHEPCAAWWTYKHYADSIPSRVRSASTNSRIASFASRGDTKDASARILIGYFYYDSPLQSTDVRLQLRNVGAVPWAAKESRLHVTIERIPNSGDQPLHQPETVTTESLPIIKGILETHLQNVKLHEAYVVTLSAAR